MNKLLGSGVRRGVSALLSVVGGFAVSNCVNIEGDLARVIVTRDEVVFNGVTAGRRGQPSTLTEALDQTQNDVPEAVELELRPTLLTLTLNNGASDLSFLTGVEVTLSCADPNTLPAIVVFRFAGQIPAFEQSLSMPPAEQPNIADYWRCGGAHYEFTAIGALPTQSWAVDTELRLNGGFEVSL